VRNVFVGTGTAESFTAGSYNAASFTADSFTLCVAGP
jgi:hypothetical protein